MRKLFYIPIVHNQADLGSSVSQLSSEGEEKYGKDAWQNHIKSVDISWNNLEFEIYKQIGGIPFDKIKIYQDGLPIIGEIGIKIIKDASDKGSINYKIIDNLISKGANIELAENKDLLIKEYNLITDIIKSDTIDSKLKAYAMYQAMSEQLLLDRDKYISNQINLTLNDVGIAFFGAAHFIIDKLDSDIEVVIINMFKDQISLKIIQKI